MQLGRKAVDNLLILLAQMGRDYNALDSLRHHLPPDQASRVERFTETARSADLDANARSEALASQSEFATDVGAASYTQPRTRGSMPPRRQPLAPRDPIELHSGGLGPLSMPADESIAPADNPNARAYDGAAPQIHNNLVLHIDGQALSTFAIADGAFATIGRLPQCQIAITHHLVTREHARITRSGTTYEIADLGSTNGTYVNGTRITAPRTLQAGDVISFWKGGAAKARIEFKG
jgi:hypothetical protein